MSTLIPTGSTSISVDEYNQMQAANMPEAVLQAAIIGAAQRLGWLVYHTHDSRRSAAGYPDLHLVHVKTGRSMFRELKRQTGKVTAEQQQWIDALTRGGHDAKVWRPIDWFDKSIENDLYQAEVAA